MKENLLIVGGGFIGSYMAKEAVSRDFRVSVISLNEKISNQKIKGVEYLVVNIILFDELTDILKGRSFHHVVNLAGYINHSNFSEGGDKVLDVHFEGTKNLARCLKHSNLKSFIQIGSSDEYGNNLAPQTETQRELPISPYSFAKVAATHFLQMLHRTENFPVVILRPFLTYGPGQDKNRFLPQVIQGCLINQEFPVSQGGQLRDFCYISDIIEAIFSSINNKEALGEIINIASGNPISIKRVVTLVQNIIGSGVPQFGLNPYRVDENMELYANTMKAKRILNWQSKVGLEEGLKNTINWYIENA